MSRMPNNQDNRDRNPRYRSNNNHNRDRRSSNQPRPHSRNSSNDPYDDPPPSNPGNENNHNRDHRSSNQPGPHSRNSSNEPYDDPLPSNLGNEPTEILYVITAAVWFAMTIISRGTWSTTWTNGVSRNTDENPQHNDRRTITYPNGCEIQQQFFAYDHSGTYTRNAPAPQNQQTFPSNIEVAQPSNYAQIPQQIITPAINPSSNTQTVLHSDNSYPQHNEDPARNEVINISDADNDDQQQTAPEHNRRRSTTRDWSTNNDRRQSSRHHGESQPRRTRKESNRSSSRQDRHLRTKPTENRQSNQQTTQQSNTDRAAPQTRSRVSLAQLKQTSQQQRDSDYDSDLTVPTKKRKRGDGYDSHHSSTPNKQAGYDTENISAAGGAQAGLPYTENTHETLGYYDNSNTTTTQLRTTNGLQQARSTQ